ncbi:MAG: glycosyltransferase [Elusimicrobia bacterium]|nr:glycosyltransferase [Elusimicrobiota bacterium]
MNFTLIPRPAPVLRFALAAVVFAVQGVGLYAQESSLWDSRREISRRLRSQESTHAPSVNPSPLLAALPGAAPLAFDRPAAPPASPSDWLSALVAEHGWVREAHISPRSGAPLIVHIQDAHGVEDAQRHIAALVGRLADADPAGPVALEGASGPIDVEALRRFPDSATTGTIADFLLQRGLIAGPEHAALTAPRSPLVIGAEDDDLYHQNVAALRAARANAAPLRDRLRRFQDRLDRAELAHASPALRAFHRRTRDHDEGRLSLTAYLEYLNGAVPARALPKAPNIEALNKIARLERTLDFKAVEVERRRLVNALVDRLPRPALADLVSSGLDVRAGRMSVGRYHARLRSVARAHGVDLRAFAPLSAYIDYVSSADAIDRAALLEEIAVRRNRVQNALARTPRERALVEIARDLALLEKAFAHTLAPTDWRDYTARRDGLLALNARYQGLDPAADATDFTAAELKPFEDFCELALSRNAALSQNLLDAIAARGADRGVLVAGGFHTDGLMALWRRQQVSYVVVAPAMREIPADNPYLDLLAQDPLPIEKLVSGERVYLSRPIALAGPGVVQRFYLALQHLMQTGRTTVAEPGVTVSRDPLRGGVSFRIGTNDLHARFNDAAETWAARWRNNFDPGPNTVGGMMFWLPRLWNASTPKALHVTAARYRGLSVPTEAGLAGLIAAGIGAAVGLPGDFDLFVRLSLAAYAVLHLGDFLTRDRRRAKGNAALAAGLVAVAGLLLGLPADGTAVVGLTPAQVAYLVFLGLHATVNLLVIRFPRAGRPTPPTPRPARPVGTVPRAAILILTHNDTGDTVRAIERMAAWPAGKTPWELIVVDNASTDAPAETLARAVAQVPRSTLIVNDRNTGAAEGRNVGLRRLLERAPADRPDYVFLVDSDVRLTASSLEDMVVAAESDSPDRVAWAPPLHFENRPDRVWRNWYHNVWRWPGQWASDRGNGVPTGEKAAVDGVATAAVLVRLEAFSKHGLFKSGYFFGNEDRDWFSRVRQGGDQIAMAPVREKILHNVHQSLDGDLYGNFSPARTYYIVRSMVLIFTYNSPLASKPLLRLVETTLTILRVLRVAVRTRNPRVLTAAWAGFVDGLRGRDGEGRGADFRNQPMEPGRRTAPALPATRRYLGEVLVLATALTGLFALTLDWSASSTPIAALYLAITFVLNGGVADLILLTLRSAFPVKGAAVLRRSNFSDGVPDGARTALTYMLRSTHRESSAEAVDNMTRSYLDNLDPRGNVIAVLVSASAPRGIVTHELDSIENAREQIRRILSEEAGARRAGRAVPGPRDDFWLFHETRWEAAGLTGGARDAAVLDLIERTAQGLKYLHRASTVLKKPGQYLDFMALATRGQERPINYLDRGDRSAEKPTFGARGNIEPPPGPNDPEIDALDQRMAADIAGLREGRSSFGENPRPVVFSILMDADNRAPPGTIRRLVEIGAANPDRGFIQPGLLPARLETWTQFRSTLTHRWMSRIPETQFQLLGRGGAYGKGLARNETFLDQFVGTPASPREVLPPALLSHDTIEALFLNPAYTGDVAFYEDTPANPISRQEQALRWTVGDLLNAAYLSPGIFGRLFDLFARGTARTAGQKAPWSWSWSKEVVPFSFEALYIAHYSTRIFVQAPLFIVWTSMTMLSAFPGSPIVHSNPVLMWASFLIVGVGLVLLPKLYQPARSAIDALRALWAGDRSTAARAGTNAARDLLIGGMEIVTSPFMYFPEIVFGPLRAFRATARILGNRLTWKVQSEAERASRGLTLADAFRSTGIVALAATAWIVAFWAYNISFTPLVIFLLVTWLAAPVTTWFGARPLPAALRGSAFFRWLMEGVEETRWNPFAGSPSPDGARPPVGPSFEPTVLAPSPNALFQDRRAPANPGLETPRPPTVPAQDHLTAALLDLAREPLSPEALKPGVVRLRNAFKTTADPTLYETRVVEAWGHATQTVRLLRNSERRVSRLPISDLPVPVVAGPTFVLDIDPTNGALFLLAPNGARRDAPTGGDGQRPLVMGRGVMERRLGLAPAMLGGVSRLHFEVVRDGNDIIIHDFSTNGTLTPARRDFAETREATVFDPLPTRRGSLWGVALGALLLTALFLAPVDVAGAATLIPLEGGGLKALVEQGDSLWRILQFAEGGNNAELVARVMDVARLNGLVDPNLIFPGQEIFLRAAIEGAPAAVETAAAGAAVPLVPSVGSLAVAPVSETGGLAAATFRLTNPILMAVTGLGLAGAIVARWARQKPRPPSDTTFLDSQIHWESVADFGDSPATPPAGPPAPHQIGSPLPWALTAVVAARWARRALPHAFNALWRAPIRGALGLGTFLGNGIHWLFDTPHRLKTRYEKHRAGYEDPSTFFAHTRTGFGDPAGPSPAVEPTRMSRFAATLYGWINRRPPAVPAGGREALAIAPDLTLGALEAMPDATPAPLGSLSSMDRALNGQSGRLAEKWQEEGLFDVPPSLMTYGDGENVLIEIPFPRAAVRAIRLRLAARRWLGVPLGKDLGYALTFLNNEGWLRLPGEARGANTPDRFPVRLAALLRDKITGGVMHDPSAEKLLVNIPAWAAWPFFFKMWWRGTREGYPRGVGLSPREEQAFFGGETLRFPSGEPLVTQVEVAWGIGESLRSENIHLGSLDAVADYVLLHFAPAELAGLADRPDRSPEESRAELIAKLREEIREKVTAAHASAAARALSLGAPAAVGLEMSLALSWKMAGTDAGPETRARLVPQIVSVRMALSETIARAPRRVPTAEATIPPAIPPAGAVLAGMRRWSRAARNVIENMPRLGGPLARAVAPLMLAAALFVLPLLVVAQGTPPPAWSLNEALVTQKIAPALKKELARSLPAGTDLAALLRNANDATSASVLASTIEHLGRFEKGRFRHVLEKTRPHIVVAPKGPEAAAAAELRNGRSVIYIGGADAQPAYVFVALVHELSHLERSERLRSKKITPTQDEGMALEDTARAMEFYAGLSVVRIAYDQNQINAQRWMAHRFLDGSITAAPHVLSPKEVDLLTAPLRAAVRLAEQRRYPGVVYLSSKNLGGGRYEVRFRVPYSGAEIVVDVKPQRVSEAPGTPATALAMLGGVVFLRRGTGRLTDDSAARAALLRSLLLGEAGPVRFDVPPAVFKNGDNYWGATGLEDLRRRVVGASDDQLEEGFVPTVRLLAADAPTARAILDGRVTAAALEGSALRETGAAAAREAERRNETTLHVNLLGFDSWEAEERDRTRRYLSGLVGALQPGTTLVVPADRPGPLGDLWTEAARRGARVRFVTPGEAPGLADGAGRLVLTALVDWIDRWNAAGAENPIGRGSRVIARNDEAVVPLEGFVIIGVARLSAAIAREIENLRTLLTQA